MNVVVSVKSLLIEMNQIEQTTKPYRCILFFEWPRGISPSFLVTLNSIVLWISPIVQNWMVLEMEVSPKKRTFQPLSLDWSGCWHRYFYQGCYGITAEDQCILHQLPLLLPLWHVSLLVLFVSTGMKFLT